MIFTFVIILAGIVVSPAHANDGVFEWAGGDGAALVPLDETPVEMVEEVVVLEHRDQGWDVYCRFVFRNTSDEKQDVTVGFPFQVVPDEEWVDHRLGGSNLEVGEPLVADFVVTVDGKQIEDVKRVDLESSDRLELDGHDLYAWEVEFEPDETVVIENTYRLGETEDSNKGDYEVLTSSVKYVLQTGGLWKGGSIGRSRIELRTRRGEFPCDAEQVRPKGAKLEKRVDESFVIRWDLKKFAPGPDDDLAVRLCDKEEVTWDTMDLYLNGSIEKKISFYLQHDEDLGSRLQKLRRDRNLFYAKYGYEFKSKDLREHFESKPWYEPNPAFKPELLTEDELEAVKIIKTLEGHLRKEIEIRENN